ncbi:MAG: LLM class flavin-dependent oxidoreductase, partial [Chloroflexi bacterium]|nr:LLM class flavin-dependent oxidoreductase [Chloroflexota bacterium]
MKFGHFCLPTYFPDVNGTVGEHMRRLVDFMVASEDLGFDAVWANEHHFHPFGGHIPSPPIFLSAIAQRTKRVRLGTSIMVMPLHNPIEIAEQLAMVDLMSGGRVELGVGRGFVVYDYEKFEVAVDEGQARTTEGLEVVLKAWSGAPFSHHGVHYNYDNLEVWPRPEQRPHPPVWVACATTPSSFEYTAKQGYKLLTVAYIKPLDKLAELTDVYRQAWAAAGRPADQCEVCTHFQVVVDEDGGRARELMGSALARYGQQNAEARALSQTAAQAQQSAAMEDISVESVLKQGRAIAG